MRNRVDTNSKPFHLQLCLIPGPSPLNQLVASSDLAGDSCRVFSNATNCAHEECRFYCYDIRLASDFGIRRSDLIPRPSP